MCVFVRGCVWVRACVRGRRWEGLVVGRSRLLCKFPVAHQSDDKSAGEVHRQTTTSRELPVWVGAASSSASSSSSSSSACAS